MASNAQACTAAAAFVDACLALPRTGPTRTNVMDVAIALIGATTS